MAAMTSSSTPTCHRSCDSSPGGYFDFTPATDSDDALIQTAMDSSNIHRLDAFHDRPSPIFEYPEHAHIYAVRPLPPVPGMPALKKPSSTKSLRSFSDPARPFLTSTNRTFTTDCCERPLPPLPLRTGHYHAPSLESVSSSKTYEIEVSRPRQNRSTSFRNFFNRNTYPQTIVEPVRSGSAMSEHSDMSSHDSRHDSIFADDLTSKPTTPTSSAPGSRRPSTLSLASLRSRKISQECVPAVPRPSSAKGSMTIAPAGRRWNLFGTSEKTIEDAENLPPVPITPPATAELSCRPCYYYSMRNCNGWVMGGSHGDACESCTMHGFFGSP